MPTPPPWWIETQVAPELVAVRALSSGQSAIASEPSSMDSVSRYGEATEPESRWSRPMAIGAFTIPSRTRSLKSRSEERRVGKECWGRWVHERANNELGVGSALDR